MRPVFCVTVVVIGIVILGSIPGAEGYDRYSENDDATYCRGCHGDFRSGNYISPVDDQNWATSTTSTGPPCSAVTATFATSATISFRCS